MSSYLFIWTRLCIYIKWWFSGPAYTSHIMLLNNQFSADTLLRRKHDWQQPFIFYVNTHFKNGFQKLLGVVTGKSGLELIKTNIMLYPKKEIFSLLLKNRLEMTWHSSIIIWNNITLNELFDWLNAQFLTAHWCNDYFRNWWNEKSFRATERSNPRLILRL